MVSAILFIKFHCLLVVILTFLVCLFIDQSVPYFPIEISRTASTGRISQQIFHWGVTSLILSIAYNYEYTLANYTIILVWIGTMIAAWIPDRQNLVIHGAGVVLIVVSVFMHVLLSPDFIMQSRLCVFTIAFGIEVARMLIKGHVIWFVELDGGNVHNPSAYVNALFNWKRISERVMDVMFPGEISKVLVSPNLTLPVLRVTGAMQWAALYLMSSLF